MFSKTLGYSSKSKITKSPFVPYTSLQREMSACHVYHWELLIFRLFSPLITKSIFSIVRHQWLLMLFREHNLFVELAWSTPYSNKILPCVSNFSFYLNKTRWYLRRRRKNFGKILVSDSVLRKNFFSIDRNFSSIIHLFKPTFSKLNFLMFVSLHSS